MRSRGDGEIKSQAVEPVVQELHVERLTEDAFESFGQVLLPGSDGPDFRGVSTHAWIMNFEAKGATQLMTLVSWYQGLTFPMLERHFAVTQTFIATGGSPSVVAVAQAGDLDDRDHPPKPGDVRAFLVEPGNGYLLHCGTWHSLDRFPLYEPGATWAVITTAETTDELKEAPSEQWAGTAEGWSLTQMYNYEEERGIVFRFVL